MIDARTLSTEDYELEKKKLLYPDKFPAAGSAMRMTQDEYQKEKSKLIKGP